MKPSTQKEILLVVIVCLLNVITFFQTALIIAQLPVYSWLLITTIIIVICWILAMDIALFFIERQISIIALLVVMTAAIIVSGGAFNLGSIGGAALTLLGAMAARHALQRDKENRIVHRVREVFSSGSRMLVIAFLLGAAGLSLPYLQDSIKENEIKLSSQQKSIVLKSLTPLLQDISPNNIDPSSTMDDLINQQIEDQGLDPTQITNNQRAQLLQSLSTQMGAELTGQETFTELVTQRINNAIQNITQANPLIVALTLIILAFLTVRSVVPVAVWILLPLLSLVIWLSQRTGLLARQKVTVETDHLTL